MFRKDAIVASFFVFLCRNKKLKILKKYVKLLNEKLKYLTFSKIISKERAL